MFEIDFFESRYFIFSVSMTAEQTVLINVILNINTDQGQDCKLIFKVTYEIYYTTTPDCQCVQT